MTAPPSTGPSAVARSIGVGSTVATAAAAVYAFGAARAWWAGRSCALAACGAEDIAWAWYIAAAVAASACLLMVAWTGQMVRDAHRGTARSSIPNTFARYVGLRQRFALGKLGVLELVFHNRMLSFPDLPPFSNKS